MAKKLSKAARSRAAKRGWIKRKNKYGPSGRKKGRSIGSTAKKVARVAKGRASGKKGLARGRR